MIDLTIPGLRLVSEANSHTHWRKRQQRAKAQRTTACWHLIGGVLKASGLDIESVECDPLRITITRIAPRELDTDNLVGSAKHVRDGIADALGINDRDPRVQWVVASAKSSGGYAVRIQIEPRSDDTRPSMGESDVGE